MKSITEEFLDLAIAKLDPEMRRNDICQLREAAIQTREALQKPSPSGFRIPIHGSYWEDFPTLVRILATFSSKDQAQAKIVLSYFQVVWPEADERSLQLYLNKGWTVVGIDGSRGELLLISKRDFRWVLARIDHRDLPKNSVEKLKLESANLVTFGD